MGTHPIFESDFDCLTEATMYRCAGARLICNRARMAHNSRVSLLPVTQPTFLVQYRPLSLKKPGKIKLALLRFKQTAKQYGVLWFAWYWGTFVPLFALFTLPYHCGFDLVGLADYLERHGAFGWLEWFGVNMRNLIDRCNNNDTFSIFDNLAGGVCKIEFSGETAAMIMSTVIIWELCKPVRYSFYLYMCRSTVAFCRQRNIMPKFFAKY